MGPQTSKVGVSRQPRSQKAGSKKPRLLRSAWENIDDKIPMLVKDGIWIEDKNGFCVFANEQAARILGYQKAEELKGKHWTEVVIPEEFANVHEQWRKRKTGNGTTYQTTLRSRDGQPISILISASSLRRRSSYRGAIAFLIDCPKQESFSQPLSQAERLRTLGEMAGGVAHDFNNLLAAILGRAQLLKLHLTQFLGPERRRSTSYLLEGLEVIERAASDGAEAIRRIQEYTHARAEDIFVSVDLNRIVRDVIELTRTRWKDEAEAKGIRVEIQEDRRYLPPVAGNPSELREVITNLVLNAIDAMPRGGSLIMRTKTDRRINRISVQDTGMGIPPENLKRIFDPFFTTKGPQSSGLGLSISQSIIRRHGGVLLVKSQVDKGTTFTIQIPVSLEAMEEDQREVISRPGKQARVLVIDDEKNIRDNLFEILSLAGHTVTLADDGRKGIALFKKGMYDLVFTDLGMPGISGLDVAKAIKEIDPEVRVVLITGWGMKTEGEKLTEKGIDLLIGKPFRATRVLNLVTEAIGE